MDIADIEPPAPEERRSLAARSIGAVLLAACLLGLLGVLGWEAFSFVRWAGTGGSLRDASAEINALSSDPGVQLHPPSAVPTTSGRHTQCVDPTFDRRQPDVWHDYQPVPQRDEWFRFYKEQLPTTGWTETADFLTGAGTVRVLNYTKHFTTFEGRLIITSNEVIAEVAAPDFCPNE